jgi:ribosomal-protein-alanine N-acetyltransferase
MVEYWGNGLISEVLPVILEFAFSTLFVDEVHALIVPENVRSKKVIEKHGFTYAKTVTLHPPCKGKFHTEDLYIHSHRI